VGTGKSTLLSGVLNDVKISRGHAKFGGSVSYGACERGSADAVPQHAWVQSGSIRENITFNAPREEQDQHFLSEVVYASGLEEDISYLQDGIE
jgi:ABC-type transport system involved in cytochrome bd biosynthesis fused ATPase/permease subunit